MEESRAGLGNILGVLNDLKCLDIEEEKLKNKSKKKEPLIHMARMRKLNVKHTLPLVTRWNFVGPFRKLTEDQQKEILKVMAEKVYKGFNLTPKYDEVIGEFNTM